MGVRAQFYESVISKCIPDREASVLVVGGGETDRGVFHGLGFRNVVITNLDTRATEAEFAPFAWERQDGERLTYPGESFDFVVANAVLHHCRSPHRALLEMYRVARTGMIAIESRDSQLMKLFEKLNLTQVYEPTAVFYNDCRFGGVSNTEIPNFIYRWTEREVEKTIRCFAPEVQPSIEYFYGSDIPCTPGLEQKAGGRQLLIRLLLPAYRLFALIAPRQQNLFGFSVIKPSPSERLQPWLKWDKDRPRFDSEWAKARFKEGAATPL